MPARRLPVAGEVRPIEPLQSEPAAEVGPFPPAPGRPGPRDVHVAALDDRPRDECGVMGVTGVDQAAELVFLGLYALQHRGQESAGICAVGSGQARLQKGLGLVAEIFNADKLSRLPGSTSIGHVRYSTAGGAGIRNAQPIAVRYAQGELAVSHNGNLTNAQELRQRLVQEGAIFQSSSDSEVIVHLIARSRHDTIEAQVDDALTHLEGAFSLVILVNDTLYAARDPRGFRPLILGRKDGGHVVASETCALDILGAEYVRDLEPGEVLKIQGSRVQRLRSLPPAPRPAPCIFELVYFARPDSRLWGISVDRARRAFGRQLAAEHPVEADAVIAVPDSANSAALGYSEQSGIPFELGLLRNHYVGRTFIQPSQADRDFGARMKYNPVREVLEGRRGGGRGRQPGAGHHLHEPGQVHPTGRGPGGALPHRQPAGPVPVLLRHRHAQPGRAHRLAHVRRGHRPGVEGRVPGLPLAGRYGERRRRGRSLLQRLFLGRLHRTPRGHRPGPSRRRHRRSAGMTTGVTRDHLLRLPKAELHVHLDGSIRPETMIELADQYGKPLPSTDPEKLAEHMHAQDTRNLEEYLARFALTLSVMQHSDALERIAYELAVDNAEENVRYLEVRYSPILNTREGLPLFAAVEAPLAGLARAEAETGIKTAVIICGIRNMEPGTSRDLADLTVAFKGRGVVAFDLAGAEYNYPAKKHKNAFFTVINKNMATTIHAG